MKVIKAIIRRMGYGVSFPVTLIILILWPFKKIRLIGLQSARIGHYALNTELMLCALDREKTRYTSFRFYNMAKPCNTQLYRMWRRIIPVVRFSLIASQVDRLLGFFLGSPYRDYPIKKRYESCATGAVDKTGLLKEIDHPHLFFTDKEHQKARNLLKKIGVSDQMRFICLVVRDSAYLNKAYPDKNWQYHNHRDADIAHYQKTALYFANKGYVVFRMGKFVNCAFGVDHPNVIDYANHPLRSDFLDIYLSAHCFFCISTCTGLDCVSQIFRRPVLLTNISPTFGETLMWYPCTLFIPKLLKNKHSDQCLTLTETAKICAPLSSEDVLSVFESQQLTLIENDADAILAAAIEMEARIVGVWHESPMQQEMQTQFWENQRKNRPIPVDHIYIKIGADFLQSNTRLLQ